MAIQQAASGLTTYTWSDENRRTLVQLPSGVLNTSTYDGDGLRFQLQDSAGISKFVWDGQNYLAEYDAGNARKVLYCATPQTYGQMLMRRPPGSPTSADAYLFNGRGSVGVVISLNSSATLRGRARYHAYGRFTGSANPADNHFFWLGQYGYYYDRDLGEYYVRARSYSPDLARFLSQDPLGFGGGDWNLFRYVANNPVNLLDPSGLATCEQKRRWCYDDADDEYDACIRDTNPVAECNQQHRRRIQVMQCRLRPMSSRGNKAGRGRVAAKSTCMVAMPSIHVNSMTLVKWVADNTFGLTCQKHR